MSMLNPVLFSRERETRGKSALETLLIDKFLSILYQSDKRGVLGTPVAKYVDEFFHCRFNTRAVRSTILQSMEEDAHIKTHIDRYKQLLARYYPRNRMTRHDPLNHHLLYVDVKYMLDDYTETFLLRRIAVFCSLAVIRQFEFEIKSRKERITVDEMFAIQCYKWIPTEKFGTFMLHYHNVMHGNEIKKMSGASREEEGEELDDIMNQLMIKEFLIPFALASKSRFFN